MPTSSRAVQPRPPARPRVRAVTAARSRRLRSRERDRFPRAERRYSSGMAAVLDQIIPEAIDERTIPGVFFRQAHKSADRVVFRHFCDGRWQPVTWAEMRESSVRVACAQIKAGVKAGER